MTEPAERETPVGPALTGAAAKLHGLVPAASTLTHLARPSPDSWDFTRLDPGALLLLLRAAHAPSPPAGFPDSLFADPAPLDRALWLLDQRCPFLDWSRPVLRSIYQGGLTLARITRGLALRSNRAHPEMAWCIGMLAPLGWLGLASLAPTQVSAILGDTTFLRDPITTSTRHLGVALSAITRRLARNWELPGWLDSLLVHLELPLEHACRFGVDAPLFAHARLAVQLARQAGVELGLSNASDLAAEQSLTGLRLADLEPGDFLQEPLPTIAWHDPREQPLLRDVLILAIDNRRLRDTPRQVRLEGELDSLHAALTDQVRGEAERLHSAKLSGLAEFAAGASHEINNPLAVISGQAQYILGHEADWLAEDPDAGARTALNTIIQQTRRIHSILRDLMQFARPASPRPTWIDLPTLLGEVATAVEEQSNQKRVRVEVVTRPERVAVLVDADQVRSALLCLVRNALEAAPTEGWVRLALVEPGPIDRIEVFVEDSGPGPAPEQRPHLFDPFYSGRNAGRGRGLGLPLAWRLARQQGGDVYLEPARPSQPTRFVLAVPRTAPPAGRSAA